LVTRRAEQPGLWIYEVPGSLLENEAQVIEIEAPGELVVARMELAIAAQG
jgi:hypothetical protein